MWAVQEEFCPCFKPPLALAKQKTHRFEKVFVCDRCFSKRKMFERSWKWRSVCAGLISDLLRNSFLEGSREKSWHALLLAFTLTMSSSPCIRSRPKYGQHSGWSGDSASPLWKCEYNNMLKCYLELELCLYGCNSNKHFLTLNIFDFEGRITKAHVDSGFSKVNRPVKRQYPKLKYISTLSCQCRII